ncbi:hypothetical protein [Corynebacterium sp. TAE3-ERU16]|nr:hypothetical protein [Corynebacterium sp. TAE3-ERU16]
MYRTDPPAGTDETDTVADGRDNEVVEVSTDSPVVVSPTGPTV